MRRRRCSSKARVLHAHDSDSSGERGSKWVRCDLSHGHKDVHLVKFPGGGWKWWPRKHARMPRWYPLI